MWSTYQRLADDFVRDGARQLDAYIFRMKTYDFAVPYRSPPRRMPRQSGRASWKTVGLDRPRPEFPVGVTSRACIDPIQRAIAAGSKDRRYGN